MAATSLFYIEIIVLISFENSNMQDIRKKYARYENACSIQKIC